jgi:hypothetical protein
MERNRAPSKIDVNQSVMRKKMPKSTHGTRMHFRGIRLRVGSEVGKPGPEDCAKWGWFASL